MEIMKKSLAILTYEQSEWEEVDPHWSVAQATSCRDLSAARQLPAQPCHRFRSSCSTKNWLHEHHRHYTHGFKTHWLLMLQGACPKLKFYPQVLNLGCKTSKGTGGISHHSQCGEPVGSHHIHGWWGWLKQVKANVKVHTP